MSLTHKKLFVSYQTNDVNLVRAVVEALRADGVDVWFAEYSVLLDNYGEFQTEIDRGIDGSAYALLISTTEWAESRWCQVEVARILQRLPLHRVIRVHLANIAEADTQRMGICDNETVEDSDNVTELKKWNIDYVLRQKILHREQLLTHKRAWMYVRHADDEQPDMFDVRVRPEEWPTQVTPSLSDVAVLRCKKFETIEKLVSNILAHIAAHTPLIDKNSVERFLLAYKAVSSRRGLFAAVRSAAERFSLVPKVEAPGCMTDFAMEKKQFAVMGLVFQLNCEGWELSSFGCTSTSAGNFNGPTLTRQFHSRRCDVRIVIGRGYPSLEATAESLRLMDDRLRYDHIRKFASAFQCVCSGSGIELETHGLHILHLSPSPNALYRTHAALTCRLGGAAIPHWQRRYSIAVTHPSNGAIYEFAFTFDFFGSLGELMRLGVLMDRLVTSLQIGNVHL